jgi:hypothetical protein
MIRAKFRCMESSNTWNHYRSYEFLPVMADDGAPENAKFWDATPAGKAEMHFKCRHDADQQFVIGDYYYIDMEATEDESDWRLDTVTDHGDQQQTAVFRFGPEITDYDEPGPRRGSLEMDVLNPAAFGQFGKAKKPWHVVFKHAGVSPD